MSIGLIHMISTQKALKTYFKYKSKYNFLGTNQWVSVTRTAPSERVTWEFFLDEFKKHYVGRIYLNNMRREFHNLKNR